MVVAVFVAGVSWASMDSRVTQLEKQIAHMPPRIEVTNLHDTLVRMERQLGDVATRVRGLERDVAVLRATQPHELRSKGLTLP
jgi:hypothetical protein